MKAFYKTLSRLLAIGDILFFVVYFFVVVKDSGEDFVRDIFGFAVPNPPLWTSHIPVFGYVLNVLFQLFSVHGIVGVFILAICGGIASALISAGKEQSPEIPGTEPVNRRMTSERKSEQQGLFTDALEEVRDEKKNM